MVLPPANPVASQYLTSGKVMPMITYNGFYGDTISVRIFGRIERISQPSFSISVKQSNLSISLDKKLPTTLNTTQIRQAFGNFDPGNLVLNGNGAPLVDLNQIVLPDGIYQFCFSVFYLSPNCPGGCPVGTGCSPSFTINCRPTNSALINTIVRPPVNPFIAQAITSGGITSTVQFSQGCNTPARVNLYGKIERLSPAPFSISVSPSFQHQPVMINPGLTQLNASQQLDAFGNFQPNNLVISGIELPLLRDATNSIKLPDGNYRICYYARYLDSSSGNASNPALGCGTFTICQAASAPQFVQPVNNLSLNSIISFIRPTSPVVFTWTPPLSTCGLPPGGFQYDFEIRELFANQGVVDAINNPFVFRKTGVPTTTFLLDTNLYKNVLQQGKKYVIRVRALEVNTASPVNIDNNGFSRVEAFQYGGSESITGNAPFGAIDPLLVYLNFNERKSDFWDDRFAAYQSRQRPDTLVPIQEYIAFKLMQNGTAYSLDAIELFYLLNPALINEKEVLLSHKANLPVLPKVPDITQRKLNAEHAGNLLADAKEVTRFALLLDSLRLQQTPADASGITSSLVARLNTYGKGINGADRVTVNMINLLLSELLVDLRLSVKDANTHDLNHMQAVVNDLYELTSTPSNQSASIPPGTNGSTYGVSTAVYHYQQEPLAMSFAGSTGFNAYEEYFYASMDAILPFNIIVYRAKTPPAEPVLNAPDLTATFRIFYTTESLYNNRNPEVNAKATADLASTAQVSLPRTLGYRFWTLNMLNHKQTKALKVEPKDVFQNGAKKWPNTKKLSIVLKVD